MKEPHRNHTETTPKLEPIHYKAMSLRLSGKRFDAIGEAVNRAPETVRKWFYVDEQFRTEYAERKAASVELAKDILNGAAPRAAERITELVEDEGNVALAASKDVLDRAGLKPTEKKEVTGANGGPIKYSEEKVDLSSLTDEELDALERITEKITGIEG